MKCQKFKLRVFIFSSVNVNTKIDSFTVELIKNCVKVETFYPSGLKMLMWN